MIINKRINFEKTLKYFMKNRDSYEPFDCHMNTYDRFYDKNYDEVDSRSKDFSFVTGLMTLSKGDLKVCVVHSWVEDRGMVIDVTSLANSKLKFVVNYSDEDVDEIKASLEERVNYIPYKTISNNKLTQICQELYYKSGMNQKLFLDNLTKYLNDIVDAVKQDNDFLDRVKEKYDFDFQPDGFAVEVID